MKKIIIPIFSFLCSLSYNAHAVKAGTYTIPGIAPETKSLALMLAKLNLEGIDAPGGAIIINVTAAETAPSGGYILGSTTLNSTTSLLSTITINGSGLTLTASAGTGNNDAIFTIQGTDFVTINNLNLKESAGNTTATSKMERGFSIVKLNNNDGCKTIAIQNCRIELDKTNTTAASGIAPLGATGIFAGNCLASSNTALVPTKEDGTHDGIYIFQDTVRNANQGIYFAGNVVIADGTAFNDKNATISENTMENFTHTGIFLSNYSNDFVNSNHIDNMGAGGTAPVTNMLFGIRYANNTTLQTNTTWTCTGNNIKLTINSAGTYAATGISTQIYGTGTTKINSDTIEIVSTGTSAQLNGIFGQNRLGTQILEDNVIRNFTTTTTNDQAVIGIFVGGYSTYTNFTTANSIYVDKSVVNRNTITNFNVSSGASSTAMPKFVVACMDENQTDSTSNFTNNTISKMVINANSASFLGYGGGLFRSSANAKKTFVTNNTFTEISVAGTANTTPITIINPSGPTLSSHNITCSGNKINKITGGTSSTIGITTNYGISFVSDKDTIADMTGLGLVSGIAGGNAANATLSIAISNCSIKNLSSTSIGSSSVVTGISIIPGTTVVTNKVSITNNLISNLTNTDTSGTTSGININGGSSTNTISNNMISDILCTKNIRAFSSSFGINLSNNGTNNVYYNTINMVSGTTVGNGYGSAALRYNSSAANIIQNNILRVNVLAGTTNNVAAIRSIAGAATAAPSLSGFTASSNIYYCPTGPNNFLYVEGDLNTALINGYHQRGLTENTVKNIVNDTFFNSDCDKSSYHRFMQQVSKKREFHSYTEDNLTGTAGIFAPSGMSYAEGTATDVATINTDFSVRPRTAGNSDIGALEFAGMKLPTMNIKIVSGTGLDTACEFNLPKLTGTVPAYFNRVSYQWYIDTAKIVGEKTPSITVKAVSSNYMLKVYDSVTGCEYASAPFRMTIMPPPPSIITYYDSLIFCESSAIVLQANKGHNYTYRWLRNSNFIAGETNDHLVVDKSGEYSLEVNTPLGCATLSPEIHVKVYPLPTPTVYFDGPRVLATQKYYLYQWYKNNVKIDSFSTNRVYYALTDGAYTVEVTDSNGCTAKSDIYLFTLGINEDMVKAAIKIFPNPATDKLFIKSPVAVNATLSDLSGRIIINEVDAKMISIGQLAEGMYLLNLTDKDGKLIKVEKINKLK